MERERNQHDLEVIVPDQVRPAKEKSTNLIWPVRDDYAFPGDASSSNRRPDGSIRAKYEKRVFFSITLKCGKRIIDKALDSAVRKFAVAFHFIAPTHNATKSECVKRNETK